MLRLSRNTVDMVKKTAPAFKAYGVEIARLTYERLRADPRASSVFDMKIFANPERSRWFAELMVMTIEHIDDLDAFSSAAEEMSERHLKEGITSAHYLYLAQAWPGAVRDVLGLGASDSVIDAWEETFWYLANVLLTKKDELQRVECFAKAA